MIDVDHLIIGSGLAGLNAALTLSRTGRVLVVTKREIRDGATRQAQGGIAGVMSADDSFAAHLGDTVAAGGGLCHTDVVQAVVAAGPLAVESLMAHGVSFDRLDRGGFDLTREGGHSARRILHAQDITGREIMRALQERVLASENIRVLTNHIAVDLITSQKVGWAGENRCLGAYVLETGEGIVHTVRAKTTLLASGGAGKVYLYTSNPDTATGDGVAMAYRAGCRVANMEFMQFHPTCLFHPGAKSFLISEALRGEGGVLRRLDGAAFMRDVHPMADLAPRDVVARAIDGEMKRWGDDCVHLDMTHHDPAFISTRFPNIHRACMSFGIDMTREPIPVVPAAHYMCGGVVTDLQARTDLPGLWAAGETACTGLHGANRLASNSLLEAAVFSGYAAAGMRDAAQEVAEAGDCPQWDAGNASDPDEMVVVSHNWEELRRAMWSYVGIKRSDKRLARAAARIRLLQEEIHQYYWDFKLTHDLVELRNLALVAELVVASAQRRRETRGLHCNSDTPDTLEAWCCDNVVRRTPEGEHSWEKRWINP